MHLGRVGAYVERAAAADCAAMVWAGGLGDRPAVPHGGRRPALGTNPVSAGFPVEDDHPVVLDFATTAIAAGKVKIALDAGTSVPPHCILDAEGRPTTDPQDYFNHGSLLPFAGHKGYSMAVVAELLGQALTGGDRPGGPDEDEFRHAGTLFLAIDAGLFRPAAEAKRAARDIVTRLRAVPPAPGFDRVLAPGDPEADTWHRRSAAGIDLPEGTWRSIAAAAEAAGIASKELPSPAS